jgi:hydrophobic/amphiphilic exporter-1 (mainly G- bacteria), HAE1 family
VEDLAEAVERAGVLVLQDVINAVQQQNQQGGGRTDRDAVHRHRPEFPVHRQRARPAVADRPVQRHHCQGRGGRERPITRLKDLARVELGAQNYGQFFKLDGQPAAGIAIFQLPEANALEVATEVRATMDRLAADFPPGLVHSIPFDTTTFVRAAIDEVWRTLFIAAVLVLIVPAFFVVVQRFSERTARRQTPHADPNRAGAAGAD